MKVIGYVDTMLCEYFCTEHEIERDPEVTGYGCYPILSTDELYDYYRCGTCFKRLNDGYWNVERQEYIEEVI